jgi:carboxyl-terminal processing protease
LREADLNKHLTDNKLLDEKPDTTGKSTVPSPATKGDTTKTAPVEFGAKNDYQLNQALNLLKGMQILQGK